MLEWHQYSQVGWDITVVGDGVDRALVVSVGARVVGVGVGTSSGTCCFHMPGRLGLSSPGSTVLAGVVGI